MRIPISGLIVVDETGGANPLTETCLAAGDNFEWSTDSRQSKFYPRLGEESLARFYDRSHSFNKNVEAQR